MSCPSCQAELPEKARFCPNCAAPVSAPAPEGDPLRAALEAALGFQYRVEKLLGRGGMGAVYLAHELALDRPVAIKVLPPERSNPELRERFKREARTAARLTHTGIVPLYTFGEVNGLLYFVMGYVEGQSLADRLRQAGRLDPQATRRILRALAEALDYAHRQGVVHRDIKPDNILLEQGSDRPVLTDFGIARAAQAGTTLTGTGHIVGTPHYMSPEQASGREVDHRSDLYSLGVTGYAMLAGRLPFEGQTPGDVLVQHLTREPPPLRSLAPLTPEPLATAIRRCLEKDPAQRFARAGALSTALADERDAEAPEDSVKVRIMRLGLGLAALGVLARGYVRIPEWGDPDWVSDPLPALTLLPAALGLFLAAAGAHDARRRLGVGLATVARLALIQPRWWLGWYPPPLRRRGDLWPRLPRRLRRIRNGLSLFFPLLFLVMAPVLLVVVSADAYYARTGIEGPLTQLRDTWLTRNVVRVLVIGPALLVFLAIADAGLYVLSLIRTHGAQLPDPEVIEDVMVTPTWRSGYWLAPPIAQLLLTEPQLTPEASALTATMPGAGSPAPSGTSSRPRTDETTRES